MIRIVSKLEIKGPNLVKGIQLEGLRVLGGPENYARFYYGEGVDEFVCMDVVASLYGRHNLFDIVSKIASNTFVPITVGGGIRTLEDIEFALRSGADRVAINTAGIENPTFLKEAAIRFGSQCIVASIEVKEIEPGCFEAMICNGREPTGKNALDWAKEVAELDVGEIMVTSIDMDGTSSGFHLEFFQTLKDSVKLPIMCSGGAGCPEDIVELAQYVEPDAIVIASLFHYDAVSKIVDFEEFVSHIPEGNLMFLELLTNRDFSMIPVKRPMGIRELKRFLHEKGVEVRL